MGAGSATIDDPRMAVWAHADDRFSRVMHIAHREWHGIRQATAYAPGCKLLIPTDESLSEAAYEAVETEIETRGINRIVFHGYSETADALALRLKATLGESAKLFAVSHVTTAQFDHYFEMTMQARLFTRLRYGTFHGLASVKPGFARVFPDYWEHTILNFAPKIGPAIAPETSCRDGNCVYVPLDVGWRKNRHTNVLAAARSPAVGEVWVTNYPNGLESLVDLSKVRLVGYRTGARLLATMAASSVVLMATLAECQPTTQLEAMAVGTPVLTGPLRLAEFARDELTALTEVAALDDPSLVSEALERLIHLRQKDGAAVAGMIDDHLKRRNALATERYAEFLN